MSDVIFKKIKFKNFMSFGNVFTEVQLDQPGTVLIVGENLDEGGSSGAGKTTVISAIAYCLYDKIPSKVSKDRLINRTNDTKNTQMEVILHMEKGGSEYVIHRWRGATTGLRILEEIKGAPDLTRKLINYDDRDWHDLTPSNTKHFNSKITELVGITYSLFSKIILYFGNERLFLDESSGTQRAMIEELLRITMLSRKAKALKTLIAETEKMISVQEATIKQQELQNSSRLQRLREATARLESWEVSHQEELKKLQHNCSSWEEQHEVQLHQLQQNKENWITSHQEEIKKLEIESSSWVTKHELELKTVEEELTALLSIDFTHEEQIYSSIGSLEKQKVDLEQDLKASKKEVTDLEKSRSQLSSELHHLEEAKCPYCLQNFTESLKKADEIKIKLAKNDEDVQAFKSAIDEIAKVKDEKQREIDELLAKAKFKSSSELTQAKTKLTLIAEKSERLQLATNPNIALLEKMKSDVNPYIALQVKASTEANPWTALLEKAAQESNPHQAALDAVRAEGEIKIDQAALEELQKVVTNQKFLLKLLTDKNSFIRKNIIGKTIPFLNKRIAFYTEELNLPHTVKFQADMACEISQFGRVLDHGNLSNGEKKRLNLALSLSFRDVLTYLSSKVNVMFTDEIDGGSLDANCVDALIHLLKHKAWDDDISIFIISHRPEFDGRCDRNLVVRKEGGFSRLILQPED